MLYHGIFTGVDDLLSDAPNDSMALLNEILNSASLEESDFSREWREVFGEGEVTDSPSKEGQSQSEDPPSFFLPSYLLDQNMNGLQSSASGQTMTGNLPRLSG